MSKLPIISGKAVIKVFAKVGYQVVRKRGSHFRLHHPERKPLTVPDHKVLGKGLLKKLLRDAELTVENLIELR